MVQFSERRSLTVYIIILWEWDRTVQNARGMQFRLSNSQRYLVVGLVRLMGLVGTGVSSL